MKRSAERSRSKAFKTPRKDTSDAGTRHGMRRFVPPAKPSATATEASSTTFIVAPSADRPPRSPVATPRPARRTASRCPRRTGGASTGWRRRPARSRPPACHAARDQGSLVVVLRVVDQGREMSLCFRERRPLHATIMTKFPRVDKPNARRLVSSSSKSGGRRSRVRPRPGMLGAAGGPSGARDYLSPSLREAGEHGIEPAEERDYGLDPARPGRGPGAAPRRAPPPPRRFRRAHTGTARACRRRIDSRPPRRRGRRRATLA